MLCQEDKKPARGDKEQAIGDGEIAEDRIQEGDSKVKDGEVWALALAVLAENVSARNVAIRRCTKGDSNVI